MNFSDFFYLLRMREGDAKSDSFFDYFCLSSCGYTLNMGIGKMDVPLRLMEGTCLPHGYHMYSSI